MQGISEGIMEQDTEILPETAIDGIPTSYVEGGIRKIVVFDESLPHQYRRLEKINGEWVLLDERPF